MPRKVPKLCHHRASGRAYVTDPATRKPVYLGRWGTREADDNYERWRAGFLARPEHSPRGTPPPGGGATVDEVLAAYLGHAEEWYRKPNGRPTSAVKICRVTARRVREVLGGGTPADGLRGRDAEKLQRQLIASGVARSTVNKIYRKFCQAWKWAAGQDLVSTETVARLKAVGGVPKGRLGARESPGVRPVEPERVEKTLPRLPATVRLMVSLQRLSGMRPGEVCALVPAEVDRSGTPWRYRPGDWKTAHHEGAGREIWFGPRCRALLGPLLEGSAPDRPLFHNQRGRPYTEKRYREVIQEACARAGVPVWNPNQLRHSSGTEVRQRFGLEGARVWLGHEKADITEEYALQDRGLAARIAEELG